MGEREREVDREREAETETERAGGRKDRLVYTHTAIKKSKSGKAGI